ncbi:hypothetical protein, partial [Pseudoalteromonas fuliginea]|uniref:hypothetical protein n=1 Tax=Pseudoalteromonas fuliginea TaxID=1872678 RepID=UPI00197EDB89
PLASMIKGCNTYEVELGYSVCDFRESIESKFKDGMSWGNHGDWHLDHIIPIAHFMKDKIYDPKIINALENLQPLWADENLKKSAKA